MVDNLIESHRVNILFPDLASTLFRPAKYFTDYARGLTERLNETESEGGRAMLRGALGLAEEEFSDFVSLTESLIQPDSDIDVVDPSPPVVYTLYEEREKELVWLVGADGLSRTESVQDIFDGLRTRQVAGMTVNVLHLIGTCNKESRIRRGEDIFRQTNAVFAAAALPLLIVKDEDGLGSFLTHLYQLIYEGAGDKKLRFLKEHGGHLERVDCNIIWDLKILRNKFTAHDPEHGSESDIRKSYSDLGDALRRLGLKGLPVVKEDFLILQREILSQMRDFLSLLIDKMQAESGE